MGSVKINWRNVAFPSDLLTIGQIREAHPAEFDEPSAHAQLNFFTQVKGRNGADEVLGRLIRNERNLFENMVATARTTDPRAIVCDESAVEKYLLGEYTRLGLAAGPHQATQLVRSMKRQAMALLDPLASLSV